MNGWRRIGYVLPFLYAAGLGCAHWNDPIAQGRLPVVDAHTHANFGGEPRPAEGRPYTKEEYLRQRRAAGVAASVSFEQWEGDRSPDLRAEHVLQCAGVGYEPELERIDAGLTARRYGCIKIYLGYIHRYASDPRYEPVYALAVKHRVPVVFHTGDTSIKSGLLKYADPLTIDEVAVAHRDVNFVIAHLGNPWIESAAEVAYKNPNVYVDISALLTGDVSKLEPQQVERYLIKPVRWAFGYIEDPSKMMFGTDWPLNDVKAYLEACKRAIPRRYWQAVFHDNAVKVYKLPQDWAPMPAGK
jgi:hypothetical protein